MAPDLQMGAAQDFLSKSAKMAQKWRKSYMKKRPLGFACLAFAALLFLLVRLRPLPEEDFEEFQGKTVTFTGRVYAKEMAAREQQTVQVLYLKREKENSLAEVKAQTLAKAKRQASAPAEEDTGPPGERVICYLDFGEKEPELGSIVRVKGKLSIFEKASNPGQFDAHSYYQILKISYRLNQAKISHKTVSYHMISEKLYQLKGFLSQKLSEALPEEEAALMQTMLLGEKSSMDKELKELYQRNGIAHILAISGLHISMLGMGLYRLLRKCCVPMKGAAAAAVGLMFLYGVMTGFSVSALRAILMFSLQMLSIVLERTYDMLTAAAVAAVGILLEQPLYFYHSGFCFSFGCVFGIGLLLPALTGGDEKKQEFVKKGKIHAQLSWGEILWQQVVKGLLGALAMAMITFPIYLWYYYQFPIYSILLNLLVIPLMSFLMGAGLLLLVCQLLCPVLGIPFALLIGGILTIYRTACEFCDSLPGNSLTFGRPEIWQMTLYLSLLLTILLLKKKIKIPFRWGIALAALLILLWRPGSELKITFLDVGQGDCIYIENDNGDCYLVDGGSSSVSHVGKYRLLPFLKFQGAGTLEAVFVTHPDEDHYSGIMELLEQGEVQGIRVKNLVLPDVSESAKNEGYQTLVQTARNAKIPIFYLSRGQRLENGKLIFTCLHPEKGDRNTEPNEYSIVLKASYGNFSALLTGDIEGNGERELMESLAAEPADGRITILKAAHHGSRNSTPMSFLESERPVYAVISCGKKNSYGHPHKELLERLENCGVETLITWESGAVSFCTDGKKVRVERFLESK